MGMEGNFMRKQEQALSPVLQEIVDMPLLYREEDFARVARTESDSQEVSQDAFVQIAKKLAMGEQPGPNTWSAMVNILERPSMQDHPKLELFRNAAQELAQKFGYDLKVDWAEKQEAA